MGEMHKRSVYDLFDGRRESAVREGPNGDVSFRKHHKTWEEMISNEIHSIKDVQCRSAEELKKAINAGLEYRQTGDSNVHSQSSRSHAFIEMHLMTQEMHDIKCMSMKLDAESVIQEEWMNSGYSKRPASRFRFKDWSLDPKQERNKIFAKWLSKKDFEKKHASSRVGYVWLSARMKTLSEEYGAKIDPCFTGKLVLVDLAGSEHGADNHGAQIKKQTNQLLTSCLELSNNSQSKRCTSHPLSRFS